MKLVNIRRANTVALGVRTEQGVLDVQAAAKQVHQTGNLPSSVDEVIQGGSQALDMVSSVLAKASSLQDGSVWLAEDTLTYGPCVEGPGKVICVGTNYRKHAIESRMPIPTYPVLFNKFNNAIAATGDEVVIPSETKEADYEAELVVVMGRRAKKVSADEALEYVFGYCNGNDISARDLQFRTAQWLTGKSCDGFAPIGPYLVTKDEVTDPNALEIRCSVNGELRQNSNTVDMIFNCAEIIAYTSHFMTLEPGDIIMTGTPEGVAFGMPEGQRLWLKPGDEVVVEIQGLGKLVNRMVSEK